MLITGNEPNMIMLTEILSKARCNTLLVTIAINSTRVPTFILILKILIGLLKDAAI